MKKLLLVLLAVVAVFCGYVALQPSQMHVARSIDISASPEAIFPQVENLKTFNEWSPWAKIDPNATITYSEPDAGEGAMMSWKGNSEVGAGNMTVVNSISGKEVEYYLEFIEPWPGIAESKFVLDTQGENSTRVTWSMTSQNSFIERAICTLMQMNPDAMIGAKYEEGLASLKARVESAAPQPDAT